ncbi:MAG: hypothetical protein ACRDVP_10010 [Acidimicrobiales bacterium]
MAKRPNPTSLIELAAKGLAELPDEDLRGDRLGLELAVSAWLRRSRTEPSTAVRELAMLRQAVLDCCALDCASEPTPIFVKDPRRAVVNLCAYLHGLVGRAASSVSLDRCVLVESALRVLATGASGRRATS